MCAYSDGLVFSDSVIRILAIGTAYGVFLSACNDGLISCHFVVFRVKRAKLVPGVAGN